MSAPEVATAGLRPPAPPPEPEPTEPPAPEPPAPEPAMTAPGVVERGSFSHATCAACGWRGPGRRARASAGRDGERHAEAEHA